MGKHSDAVVDYDAALQLQPDNPDLLHVRAVAKLELEDCIGALSDLDQALILRHDDADMLRARGEAKVELERFADALIDLQASDRLQADDPDTLFLIGRSHYELQDCKRAIEFLDRSDDLEPNDADTLWTRGLAKQELKDHEGILKDVNAACQLDSDGYDTAESHFVRADAYYAVGDYDGALIHADEALKLEPDDCDMLILRANIKLELADKKGRRQDLDKFERLKTGDPNAQYRGSGSCIIS